MLSKVLMQSPEILDAVFQTDRSNKILESLAEKVHKYDASPVFLVLSPHPTKFWYCMLSVELVAGSYQMMLLRQSSRRHVWMPWWMYIQNLEIRRPS